jgi:hypothetical protein
LISRQERQRNRPIIALFGLISLCRELSQPNLMVSVIVIDVVD